MEKNTLRQEVPVWLKSNLTIKEAAAVSGIGEQSIRQQAVQPDANFAFKVASCILQTKCNRELTEKDTSIKLNHY